MEFTTTSIPTGNSRYTCCDIATWTCPDGWRVVVFKELDANKGFSVTNSSERLATWYLNMHGVESNRVVWVEHYSTSPKRHAPPTWDMISYTWIPDRPFFMAATSPVWTPVPAHVVERLEAGEEPGWQEFFSNREIASLDVIADIIMGKD